MILVKATLLLATFTPGFGPDSAATARRIAASAELAAQEYRIGVVDGQVVAPAEVEEARLFLGEARRAAGLLPSGVSAPAIEELDRALAHVEALSVPDSLDVVVRRLTTHLATALGVTLVEIPATPPSLARGRELYARECASCHGATGAGDGGAARALSPPPSDLTDRVALADVTPLAFYQRITIGVAGTAMPAYESRMPAADRWALAAYATTLRQGSTVGDVPPALRDYAATAAMNDAEVLAALGPAADPAQVGAVRSFQVVEDDARRRAAVFATVREHVGRADQLARAGQHDEAVAAAFDAYLAFEQVERTVRAKDASLATGLEASFATLRTRVGGGATAAELDAVGSELYAGLEQAERVVADEVSPLNLFVQSLMIMLREGLEAILIIGALMAFLVKIGASHRKRDIHIGVGAAVALSLLTAVLLETVFQLSPAHQEVLEAITMLVAVGVLFYVSYWLLSKMEVQKWTAFVKERVQVAVSGGSAFALASAAFLAVYREGFETVLFYKALIVSGGSTGGTALPVGGGVLLGAAMLAVVYVLINRFGIKLPLRPFFGATSAFLYYTAFVFAGKGIAELQAGGVVGTTVLPGWPRVAALGIYPTVESLALQGLLVLLAVGALAWIFVVQRRPQPAAAAAPHTPAPLPGMRPVEAGAGVEGAVLRSLEQMEADLAALRGEVERLRDTVVTASADEVAAGKRP
ncbi:MAG: FTR1 family protein [Gemmatimonadales bacterium]